MDTGKYQLIHNTIRDRRGIPTTTKELLDLTKLTPSTLNRYLVHMVNVGELRRVEGERGGHEYYLTAGTRLFIFAEPWPTQRIMLENVKETVWDCMDHEAGKLGIFKMEPGTKIVPVFFIATHSPKKYRRYALEWCELARGSLYEMRKEITYNSVLLVNGFYSLLREDITWQRLLDEFLDPDWCEDIKNYGKELLDTFISHKYADKAAPE